LSIHLVFLYRARNDVQREEALRTWADRHAPAIAALPQVRRYVRDIVLEPPDWLGVDEVWVDDEHAAGEVVRACAAGEPAFAEPASTVRLGTADDAVVEGPPFARDASHPKRMTFLKRKEGTTRDQLLHYWRHRHGPLAASVPGLRRYVQSAVVPSAYAGGEPPFDGVAQIWIEDDRALRALVASALFLEQVKPDEANFVAVQRNVTLAVREVRVK
jgi:uncharacterized protein (TIGR02118 family)